uniref:cytochrome ubiquinol oxidase subunit I n=1 Tax=Rahnella sp. RFA10(1/100) TaxID=2511202 RepID=UPI003209AC87
MPDYCSGGWSGRLRQVLLPCWPAGWLVTELGRQPWTIFGMLRTAESVSSMPLSWVITSCCGVIVIYGLVFGFGLRHFLRYASGPLPQGSDVVVTAIPTST